MNVFYITYPWFLDFSLEYIKELSKRVNLHVLILSPDGRTNGTVFKLNDRPSSKLFQTMDDISGILQDFQYYEEYTRNCKSLAFSFFPQNWRGLSSIKYNHSLSKYIISKNPDVVHFDDITVELIWQKFFLRNMNIVIDVHDPVAHSGEHNLRRTIARKFLYSKAKKIITFSAYSNKIFQENYPYKSSVLSLVPYSFYKKYNTSNILNIDRYILFVGRISPYKGIEDLIRAFSLINEDFKDIKLVIAGKNIPGYSISEELLSLDGVVTINRYMENEEIASLIDYSEFVVCPYKDATQSGVVMTAFAFDKKVIVSKVGGLHEPVSDGNGIIYDCSIEGLVEAIERMLIVPVVNKLVFDKNSTIDYNIIELLKIYEDAVKEK